MSGDDLQKMDEMLQRHLGFFSEIVHHKLDIVMQGQQMLSERWGRFEERFEKRIDALGHPIMRVDIKVEAVAADLSAHRSDTESNRGYKVCDGQYPKFSSLE
jgi:hypothetical protein